MDWEEAFAPAADEVPASPVAHDLEPWPRRDLEDGMIWGGFFLDVVCSQRIFEDGVQRKTYGIKPEWA